MMKRLTAYVSGSVQKTGYRAKVEDKLKWFEEAININDNLIQVSSIEREYSEPMGDFSRFYKLVDKGETDSRLDTAASYLNKLIGAVNNLNDNLGKKMDIMIDSNDNLGKKMDTMIDLQSETLNAQENLLEEVHESRKDLKGYLEQRFEKLESEVTEMRAALREKGII